MDHGTTNQGLSNDQKTFIEGVVSEAMAEPQGERYEFADVSTSVTVGPGGANVKGWITYATTKIYFENGEIEYSSGAFAGAGAGVRMSVMRSDLIAGKTGTYKAEGWGAGASGGALNLYLDGVKVLGPVVISGTGFGQFKSEGEAKFSSKQ